MEDVKNILIDISRIVRKKYIMIILLIWPLCIVGYAFALLTISIISSIISMTGMLFLDNGITVNILCEIIIGYSICLPVFFELFEITKEKKMKFYLILIFLSWVIGKLVVVMGSYIIL